MNKLKELFSKFLESFSNGISRYVKAINIEIKGGIIKTPLHILKSIVIMFIPFLYAFIYLFAFFDPVDKAENLKLTIITSRNDAIGEFVKAKAEHKGIKIHNGPNVNMTADFNQIYSDQIEGNIDGTNDIVKDSLLTVDVPDMDHTIVAAMRNAIVSWENAKAGTDTYLHSLSKTFATFLASNTLNGKPSMNYNYKKNFLIGFATDISSAQSGGINEVLNMMITALTLNGGDNILKQMIIGNVKADNTGRVEGKWLDHDGNLISTYFDHHQWAADGADQLLPSITETQYNEFMTAMEPHFESILQLVGPEGGHTRNANAPNEFKNAIEIITQHSQLGTNGKEAFGFGLSPFFISIGMWFGAVAMTILVHRKIYDRNTFVRWRYFAKITIVNIGILIQATILMLSLKWIGLGDIGYSHWALMYGSAIFIGMIFATFIMAVRFSIPSRALSIYIIVIFMVLNIVCSGGLFPVQTQNAFVRAMNTWLPMHFSVEILRQGLVDTDIAIWWKFIGLLSIYLLFVPLGVCMNFIYTHRWYIRYDHKMPPHMQSYHNKWVERYPKKSEVIIKRLKKTGEKDRKGGK